MHARMHTRTWKRLKPSTPSLKQCTAVKIPQDLSPVCHTRTERPTHTYTHTSKCLQHQHAMVMTNNQRERANACERICMRGVGYLSLEAQLQAEGLCRVILARWMLDMCVCARVYVNGWCIKVAMSAPRQTYINPLFFLSLPTYVLSSSVPTYTLS